MKRLALLGLVIPIVASAQATPSRRTTSARRVDTVRVTDTLRVVDTLRIRDTLRVADTVRFADTVRVADTLRFTDTVRVVATATCSCARRSQQGRTMMMFGLGLTGERLLLDHPGQTSARTTGQLASFSFTHYIAPSVAFDLAAAVLDADATHGFYSSTATGVTTLLFGLSYSPSWLALTKNMRPFVSAAVGPYFHIESQQGPGNASTSVVSHTGGRFSGGMNIFFARILALQIQGDYHNVKPFDTVGGGQRDPSGLSMSVGLGFAFGGR